ncbi:MAG: Hsp70 family protein [Pirellulales bacterium]|nr:Hsp70 family protein [Pirellulales bacterium]
MVTRAQPNHPQPPRFVVGFDLGTTNSAVTYVDTEEEPWQIRTFLVPQLVAPGQVESRETLPSFHYQPSAGEMAIDALRLAWSRQPPGYAVGFFARDQGTAAPGRLIASAKSWLCHTGVDRTADLLPWHGAADIERLSPVEVSGRYLSHVRDAWDHRFSEHPLADQDLVLTLPASFDEVARELTVKAAARAGLPRVVLIEEPQAAFYAWIDANSKDWEQRVEPGQKILVCDIGGGTSDFTLIRVRGEAGGKVRFHRVAVGEHLILGGDNLDLALAQHVENRLTSGGKLEPRQWAVLVRISRQVKETLLGRGAPERLTVNLPGAGARLIGGGVHVEVTREEVRDLLVEGFFPRVGLDERPARRRSGFQEFGLPYAPEPAVTRYLAAFLTAHRHVALDESDAQVDHDPARPDIVLFNGGVFESDLLRDRLIEVLVSWFQQTPGWRPIVLENDRLDLAVARGAAYYGMVRRGQGVRIAAGLARTYYIGVESHRGGRSEESAAGVRSPEGIGDVSACPAPGELPPQTAAATAVCLVPAGVEPGHDINLTKQQFTLRVSEPVEFPLYVSSTRLTDRPGELIPVDREQMTPLPPMRTVLRKRKKGEAQTVAVTLHARLTEIGTLDLWCGEVDGRGQWRLVFDVRSATETDVAAHDAAAEREGFIDEETGQECRRLVLATFGAGGGDKPEGLVKRLSDATEMNRKLWPTSFLRRIWETLMEVEDGRRRSPVHEARWLNLLGFALRPGYGLAVDDWRVAETWRALQGNLVHANLMCRTEWWILWRRIAGGLAAGQQQALADPVLGPIRTLHRQLTTGKGRSDFSFGSHEAAEIWRMLGSLELLGGGSKIELGAILLDILPKKKVEANRPSILWAIGRVAARQPVYGPLNTVVPAETVAQWLRKLMDSGAHEPDAMLAVMQMARRTDDRYRDIPEKLRDKVLGWLEIRDAPAHFVELVRRGGQLDTEEQGMVFGEALPKGLRIL